MKRRILIGGITLLLAALLASSCGGGVSQEDYDEVLGDLEEAQQRLVTIHATLADIDADLFEARSELDALKEICPPGDFATVTELEDWAVDNLQRDTMWADEAFRAALKVQEAGLEDGYLVSVNIEEDVDTGEFYFSCTAIAGGDAYWWFPEQSAYFGAFWWGFSK